jgi:hypothetical protein
MIMFLKRNTENARYARNASLLLFIPLLWVVSPVVGYVIGDMVDTAVGLTGTFNIVGFFLGIAAAVRETWLILHRVIKGHTRT